MEKKFKIDVDCGEIVAFVMDEPTKKSIPIKKGKYKLTLSVKNCWLKGGTTNYDFLDVKKDSYLCFDDGFYLDENQEKFVKTSMVHGKGCIVSTGGDGSFMVRVELNPIKKIPYNPYQKRLDFAKQYWKGKKYTSDLAKEFSDKYMHNVYDKEINEILQRKQSQMMQKILKEAKKFTDFLKDYKGDKA